MGARWLIVFALVGWFTGWDAARAAEAHVGDDAQFFSAAAVERANGKIREIGRDYGLDLQIDTVDAIPANLLDDYKKEGKEKFFDNWARKRANAERLRGVYVLLCKDPGHIQIAVGDETRKKAFTIEDRNRLVKKVLPLLKEKKYDEALATMVDYVQTTLRESLGPPKARSVSNGEAHPPRPR